jgi:hypothetical protein
MGLDNFHAQAFIWMQVHEREIPMLVVELIHAVQIIRNGFWRFARQTTSNVESDRPPPCSHRWRETP